jgi:hypothetical protein
VLVCFLDQSHVDQQIGVVRRDLESDTQLCACFCQTTSARKNHGQIAWGLDVSRVDGNRAAELVDSLTRHPATVVQQPEVIARLRIQFVVGECRQIMLARAREVVEVLISKGEIEIIDGGGGLRRRRSASRMTLTGDPLPSRSLFAEESIEDRSRRDQRLQIETFGRRDHQVFIDTRRLCGGTTEQCAIAQHVDEPRNAC